MNSLPSTYQINDVITVVTQEGPMEGLVKAVKFSEEKVFYDIELKIVATNILSDLVSKKPVEEEKQN